MNDLPPLPSLPPKLEALREEMAAALRAALPGAKLNDATKRMVRDLILRFGRENADRFEEAYREAQALGFELAED